MSLAAIPPISARRRRTDKVMRGTLLAATIVALIPLVLAPAEAACTDRRAFLRVWCRKEACLKATGIGLLDDLTTVSAIADRVVVAGAAVHVQDLAISDAHAAALAIVGGALAPVGAAPVGEFTS